MFVSRSALRSATRASSSRLLPLSQSKFFSIKAEAASASKPLGLDASRLTVTKTQNPKGLSKPEDLVFGREFTGRLKWCHSYISRNR